MVKRKKLTKVLAITAVMTLLLGTVPVSAASISASLNSDRTKVSASATAGTGSYTFTCYGWEKHPTTHQEYLYNKTTTVGGSTKASVAFNTDAGYKFEKTLNGTKLRVSCKFNSGSLGTIYIQ